jgi:PiT family inorganic phosphate transporter
MVVAWVITMPFAAITGALTWWISDVVGGVAGALVIVTILVALSAYMWMRSRRAPITPVNVNDEWSGMPSASRRTLPQTVSV